MTIQTATDYIAARAFVACYGPHWSPEIEAIIGRRMVQDARAAGHQPHRPKPISRSDKARRMIAEGADATAVERATGLSRVTVRALFNGECASTGLKHGGSRISPMGLKARAMIAGGATAREVREATGMSERQAHKLIRRARLEGAA